MSLVVQAKTFHELEEKINSDLDNIFKWFISNKLVPNFDKSNYIIMGNPKTVDLTVKLGNNLLNRVYEIKILGVILDHGLRFNSHIEYISKSISNRINYLSRL